MSAEVQIHLREPREDLADEWIRAGRHPLVSRLLAQRGKRPSDRLMLRDLPNPLDPKAPLSGLQEATNLLARHIQNKTPITIVGDYDCDGATATAVAVRGLKMMGVDQVDFLIPSRFAHGYGISPPVVDAVAARHGPGPRLILTVDNGVSAHAGIEAVRARGWDVIVTDHHLPGETLPPANAIVNPILSDSRYLGRYMAGVGVVFMLMLSVRAQLIKEGVLTTQPPLKNLLDLVAVGTITDMVRLDDPVNHCLVQAGLSRIREGLGQPGIRALAEVAKLNVSQGVGLRAIDVGFGIGPRINAAGRMAEMEAGIACLLTESTAEATALAQSLNTINQERRTVEKAMRQEAENVLNFDVGQSDRLTLCVTGEHWHEGVVGIVAGRLKDQLSKPVFAFARNKDKTLKGSGRSVPGFHLRDALDEISKICPEALLKFGGHAAAAGCTLSEHGFDAFSKAFEEVGQRHAQAIQSQVLETDGEFPVENWDCDALDAIDAEIWGQGMPAPQFFDTVQVLRQRPIGTGHTGGRVQTSSGLVADFVFWGRDTSLPEEMTILWTPQVNEYNGKRNPQMVIQKLLDDAPLPGLDLDPIAQDPGKSPQSFASPV